MIFGAFSLFVWITADQFLHFSGTITLDFLNILCVVRISFTLLLLIPGFLYIIRSGLWQLLSSGILLTLIRIFSFAVVLFASVMEYHEYHIVTNEFYAHYRNIDTRLSSRALLMRRVASIAMFIFGFNSLVGGISRLWMFRKNRAYLA